MSEIHITALEPGSFGVEVREGENATHHRVTIPQDMPLDLGVPEVDHERLVRESFAFLLEREPATSILSEFALPDIGRYFPEYTEDIRARLQV